MTPREAYNRAYHLMRKQRHYGKLKRAYDNPMHAQMREMFTDALRNIHRELYSMPRRPVTAAMRIPMERHPRHNEKLPGRVAIRQREPAARLTLLRPGPPGLVGRQIAARPAGGDRMSQYLLLCEWPGMLRAYRVHVRRAAADYRAAGRRAEGHPLMTDFAPTPARAAAPRAARTSAATAAVMCGAAHRAAAP